MRFIRSSFMAVSVGAALISANPVDLEARASCTFTTSAAAIAGKTGCSTITLSNIAVPANKTLDLTGLTSGTTVCH